MYLKECIQNGRIFEIKHICLEWKWLYGSCLTCFIVGSFGIDMIMPLRSADLYRRYGSVLRVICKFVVLFPSGVVSSAILGNFWPSSWKNPSSGVKKIHGCF